MIFGYFQRSRQQKKQKGEERKAREAALEKEMEVTAKEILLELQNDPEFLEAARKTGALFAADQAAREVAELGERQGTIAFICPNCGSECVSSRTKVRGFNWRHGGFSCEKCTIHIWS